MIREFLRDRRGNYALMTVITMVPLMGGVALAVDYTELIRERQETLNALDAAGVATAQQIVTGASDTDAKAYARQFFEANLRHVLPSNTTLTVTLPNNNTGGGTLVMEASLKYHPYFLPAATMLLGRKANDSIVNFSARSEIRLKNTLEVALVLDNSGSMSILGSGTGQKRIDLLKAAAKQLVNTLALQAQQMKQVSQPVQFSLVPFSASVNVGPTHDQDSWMDQDGISPIHHENFDWTTMTKQNDANKYAERVDGVWYKRGADWGDTMNQPLTRFSLYSDMTVESDRETVQPPKQYVCDVTKKDGTCSKGHWVTPAPTYVYTTSRYASWQGCVEARPYPYNDDDTTPDSANPATLFVPMFAPDEAGTLWRDFNRDGTNDVSSTSYGYGNNWWADWPYSSNPTASQRQSDMRKYFLVKPYGSASASAGDGPNSACTTSPITPLKDITVAAQKQELVDAIDEMAPTGNTNVPEGLAWGWRTVSSNEPFTEGRPNTEKGNDKVVIVLTDGANTYSAINDSSYANDRSTYAAYGYTGLIYPGSGSVTRLFMNTTSAVPKTTYTDGNYTAALDEQMQTLCANAKAAGIMVMTVSLDLVDTKADEKKAMAALKACASDSRFRRDPTDPSKPAKLFWNSTGATLSDDFKEIGNELSNLRIVS
ncbi:hypothetical protein EN836_21100 [Mesorhizobium sp. M1C.F.Ca.ET.193.01.1.1]|uniref:pilus assembly protein TadG-related protein n=1 Tax=unclassified Mesorhizobium TaxID=325217 RepID=UPI000FD4EC71|nr:MULTISPECIES: pilus assembly protein [unclassified Mesorhizobium]TGS96350.1 hypothetical protein EN820_41640 [bacterium M00.F.Ca.ET.177.01.1.1]TGQ52150.1 hypothetical protein EN853_21090 [Mesorhizobium sp. M1C.F.Ca.ET.210.01.1.1]TGQ68755.1 hypothetical protein EN855_021100 [Mesorhizobium sp. M1C.F.Ca.ET.212.01.1.1]TGR04153.1 hypothetical protein EN847_20910 [Mesorhizobium sp. M1C.F.Ca.ET.204.01.1.1]TGR24746.1 hypothetical protein EN839_20910 [Mesorhizobium sp. M1C.F.Ca.ET.196.01.1.1]